MNLHFHQLIKGTGILSLAGIMEKGVAFILLPLYTRYLTPADYGAVELFLILLAIMDIVVSQGMDSAVMKRILYDKGGQPIEAYRPAISTGITYVLCCSLMAGTLMILFSGRIAPLLFDQSGYAKLLAFGAGILLCQASYKIMLAPLRAAQKYATVAGISFIIFCAKLAGNLICLLYLDAGFASLIYGSFCGGVVSVIATVFFARKYLAWGFDRDELRKLMKFGFPLIFSAIGFLLLSATDRILLKTLALNAHVGLAHIGLYSIAAKLVFVANALALTPFRSAWPTVYYKIAREDGAKQTFANFALRFFALGLLATLAAHWFAPSALVLLTTPEFYAAAPAVGFLMAALILFALNDILKVGMNIEARTHLLPIRVALAATLNVILGVIMIPRWGIVGAAAATMISYLFMDAFTIWACRNFYRIQYDWWSVGKLSVLAAALFLVPSLVPLHRMVQDPLHQMVLDLGLKCVLLGIFLLATLHITKIDLTSLLRRSPGGIA